jgi:hypothetical protein
MYLCITLKETQLIVGEHGYGVGQSQVHISAQALTTCESLNLDQGCFLKCDDTGSLVEGCEVSYMSTCHQAEAGDQQMTFLLPT